MVQKVVVLILAMVLASTALLLPAVSRVQAAGLLCPPPTPVTIDVRPGTAANRVNLASHGLLPVAVLTTRDFDARQFTPTAAHLTDAALAITVGCAGATAVRWERRDVNHDGRLDLVFFFRIQDLNFTGQTSAASLMAHGVYGTTPMHILGTDKVMIVHDHH